MSSKRLSATDRVRAEIDELFADVERDLAEVLEEVAAGCAAADAVRA